MARSFPDIFGRTALIQLTLIPLVLTIIKFNQLRTLKYSLIPCAASAPDKIRLRQDKRKQIQDQKKKYNCKDQQDRQRKDRDKDKSKDKRQKTKDKRQKTKDKRQKTKYPSCFFPLVYLLEDRPSRRRKY